MNNKNIIKDFVKNIVPRPLFLKIRRNVLYGFQDAIDSILGKKQALVPPKRMIFIGGNEFVKVGDEFFQHFKTLCRVMPDSSILDVGCGIGRMARPFTAFLSNAGRYEGFDIDLNGINWCKENITSRFPNFKFKYVDIYNKNYNSKGKIKAENFAFPYESSSFDFVFATSVYTHMFPADVSNYLKEAARVLKPGGICLFTYFLLNEESKRLIGEQKSKINFQFEVDGVLTQDKFVPEDAICLREDFVVDLYEKCNIEIHSPIKYGSWSGREKYLSFQDIIVASKKAQGV